MSLHYAYELSQLKASELIRGIDIAIDKNRLKGFELVGSKIRDLIHGIPSSFSDVPNFLKGYRPIS